jgi:hypothetical protein
VLALLNPIAAAVVTPYKTVIVVCSVCSHTCYTQLRSNTKAATVVATAVHCFDLLYCSCVCTAKVFAVMIQPTFAVIGALKHAVHCAELCCDHTVLLQQYALILLAVTTAAATVVVSVASLLRCCGTVAAAAAVLAVALAVLSSCYLCLNGCSVRTRFACGFSRHQQFKKLSTGSLL